MQPAYIFIDQSMEQPSGVSRHGGREERRCKCAFTRPPQDVLAVTVAKRSWGSGRKRLTLKCYKIVAKGFAVVVVPV
jgi:hypothetical protein